MSLKEFCKKRANMIIMIAVLAIYICLTLSSSSFVNFNHDEVHAWNIASNFGFFDVVRLMRSEGHTFVWFMLMKPFTGFSIFAIKWLNWVFTFSAVILLWLFSQFKIPEKILITFSCPFLLIYPVVARCYGIGLLLLFAIAVLYKRRFEHPVWFGVLIFFAANTSLMAAIPALVLGLFFGIELIIKKKFLPVLILFLAPLSLYIQWHNPIIPAYSDEYLFLPRVIDFLFGNFKYSWCASWAKVVYPLMFIASLLFFRGKALGFWLLSSASLLAVFAFAYCGFDYHFYFFYVYLILACWINQDNKYSEFFIAVFCTLSLLYCFKTVDNVWHFKTYYRENAQCIMSAVEKGATIYTTLYDHNVLVPYLGKEPLKDFSGSPLLSFENFRTIYTDKRQELDLEALYKIAPDKSYLLIKSSQADGLTPDFTDKNRYKECGDDILYRFK